MREGAAEGRPDGSHGVDADGGAAEDTAAGRPSANPTHRRERGWGCWAAPCLGTGSPGHREEAEDEGVLRVPGAEEENILCKERGGAGARGAGGGSRPGGWGRQPLTQLVKVRLGALRPRDGAHQAGLEERAPAVDEAALPSDVVLPGNESCTQPSPANTPPRLSPQRDTRAPRSDSPSLAPRPAVGYRGWEGVWGAAEWGRGLGAFSLPCSKAQAEVGTRLLLTKPARGG